MMMADHKSDHDQHHHPESSPTKSLTKIISLPAHLADMNNSNSNQLTTDSTGALKGTGLFFIYSYYSILYFKATSIYIVRIEANS